MVEMTVESVRINLATQQRVVILKATKQERYLFIWIAHAEAYAIAVELQGTTSPRPLTHDLLKNVIVELGAKIESIVISDLIEDIFYALSCWMLRVGMWRSTHVLATLLPSLSVQGRLSLLKRAFWSVQAWPLKRTKSRR